MVFVLFRVLCVVGLCLLLFVVDVFCARCVAWMRAWGVLCCLLIWVCGVSVVVCCLEFVVVILVLCHMSLFVACFGWLSCGGWWFCLLFARVWGCRSVGVDCLYCVVWCFVFCVLSVVVGLLLCCLSCGVWCFGVVSFVVSSVLFWYVCLVCGACCCLVVG